MTEEETRTYPTPDLAYPLYEVGLAPRGAECIPDSYRAVPLLILSNGIIWEPQERWDHAMGLLEKLQAQGWQTTISYHPGRAAGQRGTIELWRISEAIGATQASGISEFGPTIHHAVHYTDNGPEMVCRVILIALQKEHNT